MSSACGHQNKIDAIRREEEAYGIRQQDVLDRHYEEEWWLDPTNLATLCDYLDREGWTMRDFADVVEEIQHFDGDYRQALIEKHLNW